MGGSTSKSQQDLKFYLQRDYDISHYPSIIHRLTKKQALVHQITTNSTQQAHKIRSDVNLYKHLNCESISNILQYIPLESNKICSDQQFHYIVQQDMQKYNLKEEFFARKYYKQRFSDRQIINILKTFICGLNIYHSKFHRKFHGSIKLQVITVDQNHLNKLRLTDPLLMTDSTLASTQASNDIIKNSNEKTHLRENSNTFSNDYHNTIRQAPQSMQIRKTKFNENRIQLNEFLADIYSVGIVGLQLYRMKLFEKTEKHDILQNEIQSINNRQIKKIIKTLTNKLPEQREKVYEILKILSFRQSYHLQHNLKNGNYNKQFSQQNNYSNPVNKISLQHQNKINNKETSFSFGTQSKLIPAFLNKQTQYIPLSNLSETQQNVSIPYFDKPKNETLSNMSTDRTVLQHQRLNELSTFGSKPIIKFNSNNFSSFNPGISSSVPIFSTELTNLQPTSSSQNYINTNNNIFLKSGNPQKQRIDSFFFQQDKKLQFKQNDYSPFKKQQDISPILNKQYQLEQSNYKQIFDKYSHLKYQADPRNPNNAIQNKKMEQQMNRLLKQSIKKTNQIKSNHQMFYNQTYNLSPIIKQNNIDSPINALQPNKAATLTIKQNATKTQQFQQNQQIPVYRPNKQVQQILKRLGIGSLLYGNNQNNQYQETNKNKQINFVQTQKQTIYPQDPQILVHKGVYNISINPNSQLQRQINKQIKQVKQKNQQNEQSYEDIHDRQTTPIRPVQKTKYNSTIVEVGDDDSQYSSSGVRNTDNNVDLSNHQYVVEEYQTGSRYQGYKLNSQRDGHGKFFYQDGGYYEGQWKNNKMDGWGKLYYEGGKLAYQGNWCQDQFHGFGKVYNDNPVQIQCGFDFTNFDLLEDYWQYYEGMLVKDTKQGRGKIKLTNGQVFQGDFHNDRIQGFGKFFMKQGAMIQGIWRDSKLIKIISS